MDEIVSLVSKKTGLSKDMAKVAVNLVLDFLKKKLPKPMAGEIDMLVANESKVASAAGTVEGLLGGLAKPAGKKK